MAEPMKYKVGDWVKVVKDKYVSERDGRFGRILSVEEGNNFPYHIDAVVRTGEVTGGNRDDELLPCCPHGCVEGEACSSCPSKVSKTELKVGDRVKSEQPDYEYTGVVSSIYDDYLEVDWDNTIQRGWQCSIRPDGRVATAAGCWDNESYLSKIEKVEEPTPLTVEDIREAVAHMINANQQYYLGDSSPERKTFMRRLSELSQKIRRTFSAEQKALWRVGYIDECGNWTSKAHEYVRDLVADQHKTELVESAKEMLDLAKEEKQESEE